MTNGVRDPRRALVARTPLVRPSPDDFEELAVRLADVTVLAGRPLAERATENITPQAAMFLRETVLTYDIGNLCRELRHHHGRHRTHGRPGGTTFPRSIERQLDHGQRRDGVAQLILPLRVVPRDKHIGVLRVRSPHQRVSILGHVPSQLLQDRVTERILVRIRDGILPDRPTRDATVERDVITALNDPHRDARDLALTRLSAKSDAPHPAEIDQVLHSELSALATVHRGHILWVAVELPVRVALHGAFELEVTIITPPPTLSGNPHKGLAIELDWPQYARSYYVTGRPDRDYFVRSFGIIEGTTGAAGPVCQGGAALQASCYWPPDTGRVPRALELCSASRPPSAAGQLSGISFAMAIVHALLGTLIVLYGPGSGRVSIDLAAAAVLVSALFAAWWALRPAADITGWTSHGRLERRQPLTLALCSGSFWIAAIAHIVANSPVNNDTGLPFWHAAFSQPMSTTAFTTGAMTAIVVLSVMYLIVTSAMLGHREMGLARAFKQATEQPQECLSPAQAQRPHQPNDPRP